MLEQSREMTTVRKKKSLGQKKERNLERNQEVFVKDVQAVNRRLYTVITLVRKCPGEFMC